jgi:hypothetical protein
VTVNHNQAIGNPPDTSDLYQPIAVDSYLRCARPSRFRSGPSREGVRAFPQAGNQDVSLFEPAQRDKGRWGQGLTANKMAECRWLKPQLVAQIEYADWTDVNHLRHSKFVALRDE